MRVHVRFSGTVANHTCFSVAEFSFWVSHTLFEQVLEGRISTYQHDSALFEVWFEGTFASLPAENLGG